MSKINFITLISCLVLIGCTEQKEIGLSDKKKEEIRNFSTQLTKNINRFDLEMFEKNCGYNGFKSIISGQSTVKKSILDHIFLYQIKPKFKFQILSLIHNIREENGTASILKLEHLQSHSELTLLIEYKRSFDFIKYRIEFYDDKLVFTDVFSFADDQWYSDRILNERDLSSRYKQAIGEKGKILWHIDRFRNGDTLDIRSSLYRVPTSRINGNWLSLKKLYLAKSLGDSVYAKVLQDENKNNGSTYIKYIHNQYFDSTNVRSNYNLISKEVGTSERLETLIQSNYKWKTITNDENEYAD